MTGASTGIHLKLSRSSLIVAQAHGLFAAEGLDVALCRESANAPAPVHAVWLAGQMQRWGHIGVDQDLKALAGRVHRPDPHAQARAAPGLAPISLPTALIGFAPQ